MMSRVVESVRRLLTFERTTSEEKLDKGHKYKKVTKSTVVKQVSAKNTEAAKEEETSPTAELSERKKNEAEEATDIPSSVDANVATRSVHFQDPIADNMDITEAAEMFLERVESSGILSAEISITSTELNESSVRTTIGSSLANRENFLLLVICITTTGVTYLYWEDIMKNRLPLQVVALWMSLMFLEGYIIAENRCDAKFKVILDQKQKELDFLSQSSQSTITDRSEDTAFVQERRTFLESVLRLNYSAERVVVPSVKAKRPLTLPKGFFSCLQNECVEPTISESLLKRLLRPASHTKTPDGKGIIPICKYRGMDILLTDSPEDPIYKNRYLNECGLRDVPTLILNVILGWANIVLYYEMPHWVKNFDCVNIDESDPDDIKVFKKFLQGDAEYRRLRMQFLPVLVDGPFAVRMIAPEKKELIGRATLMSPFSWYSENESVDRFGSKKCALMEGSVDVTTSYLSRTATNILRRFIDSIHLDVAFVIDQPELQKEFEPSCVIGLCQVKHVNVAKCALLPIDSDDTMLKASTFVSRMELS